jgi:hypothetical protein
MPTHPPKPAALSADCGWSGRHRLRWPDSQAVYICAVHNVCVVCGTSTPRRRDARASTATQTPVEVYSRPTHEGGGCCRPCVVWPLSGVPAGLPEGCIELCVYVMCIMYVCSNAAYGAEHAVRPSTARKPTAKVRSRPTHEALAAADVCRMAVRVCWPDSAESDGY